MRVREPDPPEGGNSTGAEPTSSLKTRGIKLEYVHGAAGKVLPGGGSKEGTRRACSPRRKKERVKRECQRDLTWLIITN